MAAFWLSGLLIALYSSFDEQSNIPYFLEIGQTFIFYVSILFCFSVNTERSRSSITLITLYIILSEVLYLASMTVSQLLYFFEVLFFNFWAFWVAFRPDYATPRGVNTNNVILAFYKGEKGSFIMNLFELFGLPVKSVCIVAGNSCLKLKSNRDGFCYIETKKPYIKNDIEYYYYDTGIKVSKSFIEKMKEYDNIKARKAGLRIRCIEAISDLLSDIREEYRPKNIFENIPSLYFRRIIRI